MLLLLDTNQKVDNFHRANLVPRVLTYLSLWSERETQNEVAIEQ